MLLANALLILRIWFVCSYAMRLVCTSFHRWTPVLMLTSTCTICFSRMASTTCKLARTYQVPQIYHIRTGLRRSLEVVTWFLSSEINKNTPLAYSILPNSIVGTAWPPKHWHNIYNIVSTCLHIQIMNASGLKTIIADLSLLDTLYSLSPYI